jgi:hypothetical protein
MPTFLRNMLSSSSGTEVTSQGSRVVSGTINIPLLPCLTTTAPENGYMFLRNVGIDLQIHMAPKPNTSTTT